jgi:hypothetical protein
MTREELEQLIDKFRHLSVKYESRNNDKSQQYERFVEWVDDNIDTFEDLDDFASDEDELWNNFLEAEDESRNWDSMFPNTQE